MYLIACNNGCLHLPMLKSRKSLLDCSLDWHLSRLWWVRSMCALKRMDLCLNKTWERMWRTSLSSDHTWIQGTLWVHVMYKVSTVCQITISLKNYLLNPFTPKSDFIDFTLSNARRFYSSEGDPLGVKGSKNYLLNPFTPKSDLQCNRFYSV